MTNDNTLDFAATPLTPAQHQQLIDICARVSREEQLVLATPEQRQQILDEEAKRAIEEEEAAQAKIEALRKQVRRLHRVETQSCLFQKGRARKTSKRSGKSSG